MDYDKFKEEYLKYQLDDEWFGVQAAQPVDWVQASEDVITFDDRVNSPSHYTSGSQEVIDIIEDAIKHAPSNVEAMLQAQVLKYLLRIWLKDNPMEDAKKARWYLNRLIEKGDSPR